MISIKEMCLEGKKVIKALREDEGDHNLTLIFDDGSVLELSFSAPWGNVAFKKSKESCWAVVATATDKSQDV